MEFSLVGSSSMLCSTTSALTFMYSAYVMYNSTHQFTFLIILYILSALMSSGLSIATPFMTHTDIQHPKPTL